MDRNVITPTSNSLPTFPLLQSPNQLLGLLSLPTLEHPALAHPAEDDGIHNSLDLSFQQAIAVSNLDSQIIDHLSHQRYLPLQTLTASCCF